MVMSLFNVDDGLRQRFCALCDVRNAKSVFELSELRYTNTILIFQRHPPLNGFLHTALAI